VQSVVAVIFIKRLVISFVRHVKRKAR